MNTMRCVRHRGRRDSNPASTIVVLAAVPSAPAPSRAAGRAMGCSVPGRAPRPISLVCASTGSSAIVGSRLREPGRPGRCRLVRCPQLGPAPADAAQPLQLFLPQLGQPHHTLVDDPNLRLNEAEGLVQQREARIGIRGPEVRLPDLRQHGIHVQCLLDLREGEAEQRLQLVDPHEERDVPLREQAEAPGGPPRGVKESELLVVPDGPGGEPGAPDHLLHPALHPGVGRGSVLNGFVHLSSSGTKHDVPPPRAHAYPAAIGSYRTLTLMSIYEWWGQEASGETVTEVGYLMPKATSEVPEPR